MFKNGLETVNIYHNLATVPKVCLRYRSTYTHVQHLSKNKERWKQILTTLFQEIKTPGN